MTSITLTVTGAKTTVSVSGPLTSGMVGIPVFIQCSDEWKALTKNLICRCGQWGPDSGETRTVMDVEKIAAVAHEVMKPGMHLYLGLEGYRADGKQVIPTTWADCGIIQPGANTGEDPSADPTLAIWAQLQERIKWIQNQAVTREMVADAVADYLEENPIGGSGSSQGFTAEQIMALHDMFKVCAFIREDISPEYAAFRTAFGISDSGEVHTHAYTSAVTREATCTTDGQRTYTCACGSGYTETIPATGHDYVSGVCTVCGAADPNYNPGGIQDKTLTRISATYSGGVVEVGTAVNDLTGITVTGYLADGTTNVITDYTLSGKIVEGENTITVSYGGKTATFAVTGIAESGGTVENLFKWTEHNFTNPNATLLTVDSNAVSFACTQQTGYCAGIEVESGKTYTLFFDASGIYVGIRLHESDTETVQSTTPGTNFATVYGKTENNYKTFTVNAEKPYINLGFMCNPTDGTTVSTWTNIALYEGTLTERP